MEKKEEIKNEMIIRAKHRRQFTKVDNRFLRDPRLNATQKGILTIMLSLPDDWVFRKQPLQELANMGRNALNRHLKALEKAGYLVRRANKRDANGQFYQSDWTVYEVSKIPYTQNGYTVNGDAVNGHTGSGNADNGRAENEPLQSTNRSITDISNIDLVNTDSLSARERERTRRFNNCPERDYDMEELEKRLLETN